MRPFQSRAKTRGYNIRRRKQNHQVGPAPLFDLLRSRVANREIKFLQLKVHTTHSMMAWYFSSVRRIPLRWVPLFVCACVCQLTIRSIRVLRGVSLYRARVFHTSFERFNISGLMSVPQATTGEFSLITDTGKRCVDSFRNHPQQHCLIATCAGNRTSM